MKVKIPEKIRLFLAVVFSVLLLVLAIAIFTILNSMGYGWIWPVVALLIGIPLILVLNLTPLAHNVLPFLENIFPVISNLRQEITRREESSKVADKMEYTMEFYGLIEQLKVEKRQIQDGKNVFHPAFYKELMDHLLSDITRSNLIRRCADKIAENMGRPLTGSVLELLYQERDKINTSLCYGDIKQNREEMLELANILDHSGRLPDRIRLYPEGEAPKEETNLDRGYLPNMTEAFPYSNLDIVELLNDRDEFHLDEIERGLNSLREVWEVTVGYLAFLATNHAPESAIPFSVSDLIRDIRSIPLEELPAAGMMRRLDDPKTALRELELYKAGDLSLSTAFAAMDLQTRTSLNLISQILYFTEKRTTSSDLKIKICREASKMEIAVEMALAYLEYKEVQRQDESFDGLTFVNTNYIAKHWLETIKKKKQELGPGFNKEISVIRDSLAEGIWWTRLPPVVEKTLNIIIEEWKKHFEQIKSLVDKREDAGESIKRIFRSLSLRTIERFLEAKTIIAYLLTFDIQEGSLARLVDVFRNPQNYEALESFGINMKFNEKPKYAFKEYIKQCRLGIVPPGMTFEDFYRAFQQDLEIAYDHREELEIVDINNFEIIIHRFGLTGRDRYGFDDFMLREQRKHALPKIRELFSDHLDLKDLVALIGYERKSENDDQEVEAIFEIMMDDTIKDLVLKQVGDLSSAEKKALVFADPILKMQMLDRFGQTKIQTFAKNLRHQRDKQQEAWDILAQSIQGIPNHPESFDNPQRCTLIAKTYIETVVDIAGLFS